MSSSDPADPSVPPPAPFAPAGFEIVGPIGSGSMGEVYRAIQRVPRREVALKMVDGDGAAEAQALADARHPTIPEVYLVETGGAQAFVAMELVDGVPLHRWAETASIDDRLAAFVALCEGVHQVHEQGVLHRDLKPANILMDASGPRLVDFGLAARTEEIGGGVIGTLSHMADEILRGEPASVASEVFALGCILVLLVSGEPAMPYQTQSPAEQAEARGARELPPLPPPIRSIIEVGLAPRPSDRFDTVKALGDEVDRYRRGLFPRVHRPTLRERADVLWGRYAVPLVVAACVGVVIGGVYGAGRIHEIRAARALERLTAEEASAAEQVERLERFLELPDVEGTEAQQRARLLLADHLHQLGRFSQAEEHRARVFVGGGGLRTQAADDLARDFVRTRRWASVEAAVPFVSSVDRPRLARMASVGLRDWSGPDVPAIFAHLRGATRTEHPAHLVWAGDDDIYAWRRGAPVTRIPRAGGGAESIPWPAGWGRQTLVADYDGPVFVVDPTEGDALLLRRPRSGGWDEVATVPLPGKLHAVAVGDPNGDGVPSFFIGTAPDHRVLRVLEPPDWTPRVASPMVDAAEADVGPILVVDLDSDGVDEVVVGMGAWRAHDLRVFHQEADGTLSFVARERFGGAQHVEVLALPDGRKRLVTLKADIYPNPLLFGAETPFGRGAGLYVLAFDGTSLHPIEHLPIDALALPWAGVLTGDLDGDGDLDVVGGGHADSVVLEMDAEGRVVALHRVAGMRALAVANLDDDPADELFAVFDDDPRLWILGRGSTPVPSLRKPVSSGTELESLGLQGPAARIWRGRAEVAEDAGEAAASYLRASELFEAAGQQAESLAMVEAALQRVESAPALERKGRLLTRLARYADLATLPETARPRPGPIEVLELGFDAALPPGRWHRPTAVRYEPGNGLRIEGAPGHGLLYSLPVHRVGDTVSVEAELEVASAEAGAELRIALVGEDGSEIGVELHPWGGALQVSRSAQCTRGEGSRDLALREAGIVPVDHRASYSFRAAAGAAGVDCAFDADGVYQTRHRDAPANLPDQLELQIRLRGPEPSARLDAVVRRIVLTGVAAAGVPEDPARDGLVRGDLAMADQVDLDRLERLEIDGMLGRTAGRGAIESALRSASRERVLASLRRSPDFWLQALRRHAPETLADWVPSAWTIAFMSGPSSTVDRHLDRIWLDTLDLNGPLAPGYLLARADGLLRRGELERARRIYENLVTSAPGVRSEALLGLTRWAGSKGSHDEARAFCDRARAASEGFLFDDRTRADPQLAPFCPGAEP